MSAPLPPLLHIPHQIAAVLDYADYARERMTPEAWAYFFGGAADEVTLRENTAAFDKIKLRSRVLESMEGGSVEIELFGRKLAHPLLLAPVAYQKLAHADGELASVLAASAMKATMVVSAQASVSLEDIARVAQAPLWFQLYVQHDRPFVAELIRRIEAAKYQALVVTVDAPVTGVRNREQRSGFELPSDIEAINLRGMQPMPAYTVRAGEGSLFSSPQVLSAVTWRDIDWLRSVTALPILLKGITHPEDARQALEVGVDGLIVSNHGGRVLDTMPAAIDLLSDVAREVAGRIPVLFDGGIRRGTDVLKALALGANAVLIGRPYIYGLAAAGAVGVAHVLHVLRTEFEMAMILTGCRSASDINRQILWPFAP